jgi:tRNA(Ile)-lysidine synthase
MALPSPAPELIARFRKGLAALAPADGRLGLAVSGGPDSLALLLLAATALPGRVEAATVDHRLRPESLVEALHVEDICERLGCRHQIIAVGTPPGPANLQAEARQSRYSALARWAASRELKAVVTAHHADDQAETLLMRLARGSGVGGLAGIRPVQRIEGLTIIRPLLGWAKADLVRIVADAGIEPMDDPSNRDPRFDRAAMRALLQQCPRLETKRLARSAAACAEADEALEWIADRLAPERLRFELGEWLLDPSDLPRELRRRLLMRGLEACQAAEIEGLRSLDALLATLERGEVGTLAGVRAAGGPQWRLTLAAPRRVVRA